MAKHSRPAGSVVIGAGQAGLANSDHMTQRGLDHDILERDRFGECWRVRWDSLCTILPNWYNCLPSVPYRGIERDGLQTREERIADLDRYATSFASQNLLPPVAVLVANTGNFVSQIAENLYRAGRTLSFSVGYSGFLLSRSRGRDKLWWYLTPKLNQFRFDGGSRSGLGDTTGGGGGRALNRRRFEHAGVHLFRRLQSVKRTFVALAPDFAAKLVAINRRADVFRQAVDADIDAAGLDARPDEPGPDSAVSDTGETESPATINVHARGIASVDWAIGYWWDFRWLRLPARDTNEAPSILMVWALAPVSSTRGCGCPRRPRSRSGAPDPKPSGSPPRTRHGFRISRDDRVRSAIDTARHEWGCCNARLPRCVSLPGVPG